MCFLNGLLTGVLVKKLNEKLGCVISEIEGIFSLLRKHNNVGVYDELRKRKECVEEEKTLISLRISEFRNGIECVINYLEGLENEGFIRVCNLGEEIIDWSRIHCLIMRECKRIDDGLPIYGFRQMMLRHIQFQQMTVLVGETGSGKSTQLVQFLADSGISGNGSVICTQPRKLAANSLASRVKEECQGCYDDNSITYSSGQKQFDSKIIFMTDHCLLQHCMDDKTLSKISCIIVDEAHEISLNTDLLLALIKKLLDQRLDLKLILCLPQLMQTN